MPKPARVTLVFENIYFAKYLSVLDIHFPVQQFTAGCKSRDFTTPVRLYDDETEV